MKSKSFIQLQELAITPGDATPDPGETSWAWSTVINAPVYWDNSGNRWRGVRPIHVGTTAPANPAPNDIWIDIN